MLMEDTNAASSARDSGIDEGVRPPPISTSPPTAVRPAHTKTHTYQYISTHTHTHIHMIRCIISPEMALVTDISGECSAGVTPHTV